MIVQNYVHLMAGYIWRLIAENRLCQLQTKRIHNYPLYYQTAGCNLQYQIRHVDKCNIILLVHARIF